MIISAVVAGWIGLSALVMYWTDAAPGALVVGPTDTLIAHMPDTTLMQVGPYSLTLRSRPGLTADLYAAGAWLVLPAGLTGCISLPDRVAKR